MGHRDVAAWALQLPDPPQPTASQPPPCMTLQYASCPWLSPVLPRHPWPAPGEAAAGGVGPVLRAIGLGRHVQGLLERPAAVVAVSLDRAIPLAAYHRHVGVLKALLARFLWHRALLAADIWAGVQAAAIGGFRGVGGCAARAATGAGGELRN